MVFSKKIKIQKSVQNWTNSGNFELQTNGVNFESTKVNDQQKSMWWRENKKKKEMGRKMRRISFALSTNQYMMVDFNFWNDLLVFDDCFFFFFFWSFYSSNFTYYLL